MNCNSNHLVSSFADLPQDEKKAYEMVPEYLRGAARRKLAGKSEAQVSLNSGGKLSRWAASKRKKKRQAEKAARRANRCRQS